MEMPLEPIPSPLLALGGGQRGWEATWECKKPQPRINSQQCRGWAWGLGSGEGQCPLSRGSPAGMVRSFQGWSRCFLKGWAPPRGLPCPAGPTPHSTLRKGPGDGQGGAWGNVILFPGLSFLRHHEGLRVSEAPPWL